jgi:hypothetical protein
VQLAIGEQTILFTDMVGSTNLYATRGDPGAFVEVAATSRWCSSSSPRTAARWSRPSATRSWRRSATRSTR